MRYKTILGLLLALLLIGALGSSGKNVISLIEPTETGVSYAQIVVHEPIIIESNDDFLSLKEANEWSGSGFPGDPIEIANYMISFYYEGITIKNVDLHFAIINCETGDYGSEYWGSTGIKLINCSNGLIEDSVAHMKNTGIFIADSCNIRISSTTTHDCYTGLTVVESKYVYVENNNFGWNDWIGVNFTLTDQCTLVENSIISIPEYPILCVSDKSTYIQDNIITSSLWDVEEFEGVCIFSFDSWNIAINDNIIDECQFGLKMILTNGSWVWENVFSNSTECTIYLGEGTYNITVVNNTIGPTTGSNAYDSGSENAWDDPYSQIGNYWSDYSGSGFYYIPGPAGSIDHFPNGTIPDGNITLRTTTTTTNGTGSATPPEVLSIVIAMGSSIVIIVMAVLIVRNRP